jgi:hypothetical protein
MTEAKFEARVVKRLEGMFPGCILLKLDPSHIQGIPDRLLLWGPYWASLEFKVNSRARRQPNQDWYVNRLDQMSFAAFIHPGNEEEVLRDLQHAFSASGDSRLPQR